MHLPLKFVTDIIRPWEKLNIELINQNSIDTSISDFISIAGDLAVKISHFAEIANRKDIRTNKNSIPFNIIVDVADAWKHNTLNNERNNKLSVSSMFEGNEENKFRFIRNYIRIEHYKYGKSDFLKIAKEAIDFLIKKLNYTIFWPADILEAAQSFTDEVFLNLIYNNQIAWTGLNIEFVKKNELGEFIHYDPPSWLFKLESPVEINSGIYYDYVFALLKRSVNPHSVIETDQKFSIDNSGNEIKIDFLIKKSNRDKNVIIAVQLLEIEDLDIEKIVKWTSILGAISATEIILISKYQISKEIKEFIFFKCRNIYLVEIKDLEAINIPLHFFHVTIQHSNLRLTSINNFKLGVLEENKHLFQDLSGKSLKELGNNFSRDKERLISPIELFLSFVKPKNNEISGKKVIDIKPRSKLDVFYKIGEDFIKVGIEAEFEWASDIVSLKAPILIFKENSNGVSLWKLESYLKFGETISEIGFSAIKYGDTTAVGFI